MIDFYCYVISIAWQLYSNLLNNELRSKVSYFLYVHMQNSAGQVWDASFSIQALLAIDLSDEIGQTLMKGHDFLKKSQVFHIII
jgi:squalene cyclase